MYVADLVDRYNISQSKLQTRIRFLGLKPTVNPQKGQIFNHRDLILLDGLDTHFKNGGNFNNYVLPSTIEIIPPVEKDRVSKLESEDRIPQNPENDRLNTIESYSLYPEAINKEIEDYFALNQRLKYNGVLEELASRGWGITSSEIKEIIGKKPKGDRWQYDCFLFVKQGKIGNKITWRVIKQNFDTVHKVKQIQTDPISSDTQEEFIEAGKDFYEDLKSMFEDIEEPLPELIMSN